MMISNYKYWLIQHVQQITVLMTLFLYNKYCGILAQYRVQPKHCLSVWYVVANVCWLMSGFNNSDPLLKVGLSPYGNASVAILCTLYSISGVEPVPSYWLAKSTQRTCPVTHLNTNRWTCAAPLYAGVL